MLAFPNAKINLGLNITGIRNDGFHDIETVLYPVSFCDILEIMPSDNNDIGFRSSGLPIPGETTNNLCIRAYQLLHNEFQIPGVKMNLHKVIPMGAGLGGGSSDAAFTIMLLNKLFSLDLSPRRMMNYAGSLGSDCAFFINNEPVFAQGKGDQFSTIDLNLSGYNIVIVVPPIHVSTVEAYRLVASHTPDVNIHTILKTPVEDWKNYLINDFEVSVFTRYPEINKVKQHLYESGAVYASMSGSGSAVFGLFDHEPNMKSFNTYLTWIGKLS